MEQSLLRIGEYSIHETLSTDQLFRWVRASPHLSGDEVLLQLLNITLQPTELSALIDYFTTLQAVGRSQLMVPLSVISDPDNQLVVVYEDLDGKSLRDVLPSELSSALWWISRAGQALHALHQQRIVHGNITLDAFLVSGTHVILRNFGYAPLIALENTTTLAICRDHLAPEVTADHQITTTIDLYAFAVMLSKAFPQLTAMSWYQQATDTDQNKRFTRIRTLISELEQELTKSPQQQPEPVIEGGLVPKSDGSSPGIVPKPQITPISNFSCPTCGYLMAPTDLTCPRCELLSHAEPERSGMVTGAVVGTDAAHDSGQQHSLPTPELPPSDVPLIDRLTMQVLKKKERNSRIIEALFWWLWFLPLILFLCLGIIGCIANKTMNNLVWLWYGLGPIRIIGCIANKTMNSDTLIGLIFFVIVLGVPPVLIALRLRKKRRLMLIRNGGQPQVCPTCKKKRFFFSNICIRCGKTYE